jgi:hypothetical protein
MEAGEGAEAAVKAAGRARVTGRVTAKVRGTLRRQDKANLPHRGRVNPRDNPHPKGRGHLKGNLPHRDKANLRDNLHSKGKVNLKGSLHHSGRANLKGSLHRKGKVRGNRLRKGKASLKDNPRLRANRANSPRHSQVSSPARRRATTSLRLGK